MHVRKDDTVQIITGDDAGATGRVLQVLTEENKVRVEIYCIADGYQSARGVGAHHPLKISVMAKDKPLGTAHWHFPDVICGHADPMHFAADLDIGDSLFGQIDRIELEVWWIAGAQRRTFSLDGYRPHALKAEDVTPGVPQ